MFLSHHFAFEIRYKDMNPQIIVDVSSDWTDSLVQLLSNRLWS